MAAIILPRGSALRFNGNDLTEHNRGELSVDIERIENSKRMANGALRKYVIADKKKWSVSWKMCPNDSTKTVDGKWGGADMLNFYNTVPGIFTLVVKNGQGVTETYSAVITEFSYNVIKRSNHDAWDISMTFEEA